MIKELKKCDQCNIFYTKILEAEIEGKKRSICNKCLITGLIKHQNSFINK